MKSGVFIKLDIYQRSAKNGLQSKKLQPTQNFEKNRFGINKTVRISIKQSITNSALLKLISTHFYIYIYIYYIYISFIIYTTIIKKCLCKSFFSL